MSEYERKALREHAEHHYGENQMNEPNNFELVVIAVAVFVVIYALIAAVLSL
jgi:hypothetical protein